VTNRFRAQFEPLNHAFGPVQVTGVPIEPALIRGLHRIAAGVTFRSSAWVAYLSMPVEDLAAYAHVHHDSLHEHPQELQIQSYLRQIVPVDCQVECWPGAVLSLPNIYITWV
jgi:hypothetical protein